jgi:hypothetical protein
MRGWLLSASANRPKGAGTLLFGVFVAEAVGDMQVARRLPHRPLAATVVAGRGRRVLVPRELLYGSEVGRVERQRCGKANLGPLRVRALAA